MVFLGGDLAYLTSADTQTIEYVNDIFSLGNPTTLWALGNHDYSNLDLVSHYTNRPHFYTATLNNLTFIVLDTQDTLSDIIGAQFNIIKEVTDTIQNSSHLILLHHKLIWMCDQDTLEQMIDSISNVSIGNESWQLQPNNFYRDIYPLLLTVKQRGIAVLCIAGDMGFRSPVFEHTTEHGITFLGSGIDTSKPGNKAIVFEHNFTEGILTWSFVLLTELQSQ
jgi:hypothetical protein